MNNQSVFNRSASLSPKEDSAATSVAMKMIVKSGYYAARYKAMTMQIWSSKNHRRTGWEEDKKNLIFWITVSYRIRSMSLDSLE